jgi:DNA-directed RNA polymerase subunit M/transcription elongation factor TFIIS
MSTTETPSDGATPDQPEPLPEPIKLRWDGDARERFRDRLEALETERSELALATLSEFKTRVVCESVAQAEAFTEEVRTFCDGLKHGAYDWVNRGHVSAVERVATTVNGALESHYERHPPEAAGSDLADEREAAAAETAWRARCPDCGWSRTFSDRFDATDRQWTGCPTCNRGVGVAPVEVATDGGTTTEEAGDAPDTCPECGSFWSEPDHSGAKRCKSCGYVPESERITVYRAECSTCDWTDHAAFLNRAAPANAARIHNEKNMKTTRTEGTEVVSDGCGNAEIVEYEGYLKPCRCAAILDNGGEDGE